MLCAGGIMGCKHQAVLIVTRSVKGTASSVAKSRIELQCSHDEGHDGSHHDADEGESWEDRGKEHTHVFRHEDE